MRSCTRTIINGCLLFLVFGICGCSSVHSKHAETDESPDKDTPPPAIRAWMDRLTVEHEYDPETGFIVAREVITLPPVIADGPTLDEALRTAEDRGRVVIVFATADRCAPCQQYKKSALNDPRVVSALSSPRLLATHVEVDKEPALATDVLGSRAIPMTYAIRGRERIAMLRGQRSADELLEWIAQITPLGSPDVESSP